MDSASPRAVLGQILLLKKRQKIARIFRENSSSPAQFRNFKLLQSILSGQPTSANSGNTIVLVLCPIIYALLSFGSILILPTAAVYRERRSYLGIESEKSVSADKSKDVLLFSHARRYVQVQFSIKLPNVTAISELSRKQRTSGF